MKKLISLIALSLLTIGGRSMASVEVIPNPKFAREQKGVIVFKDIATDFSSGAADQASQRELQRFFGKKLVKEAGKRETRLVLHAQLVSNDRISFAGIPASASDSALASDEGYVLAAAGHTVEIRAKSTAGVFYAVTTFLQLIRQSGNEYSLPRVDIADYPSLALRGISDDISRGQISTMANFKKIIRFLAMHKMNVYMPYIENLFAFKSYPAFSEGRDPLTAEQVAELDAYAKAYHVQIIPAFETLGHMEDVLMKPQFEKYAEFPGSACLDISSDWALTFVESLLSEIAPAFSSRYFNMAADESFDVGLGASKRLVDSLGITGAYAQYYLKLYEQLKSMGKTVLMYGDIILDNPQILSQIPKDIIIVDWHYGAAFNYPSVSTLKDAGFKFIASPAVWNFTGPFPNFYNSYANIQNFAREAYDSGGVGLLVSTWNDFGGVELRELNYPGYAWGAECAWNPDGADPGRFEPLFFKQYFGTSSRLPRIAYELLSAINNQVTWAEFWRAPFMDPRWPGAATNVESVRASMSEISDIAGEAEREAGDNSEILRLYQLVTRINAYWADRVAGIRKMRQIASDTSIAESRKKSLIIGIEKSLLGELAGIKRDYVKAYLRTNRKPMLQLIEARFDQQAAQLESGSNQLIAGNTTYNQSLPSSFIYYPGSVPYSQGGNKVDSATFSRSLDLAAVPENPLIQLIGDTYCKLFVNGQFVGEVKARRTLTWDVEFKRVQLFNLRPYLKVGKNTIVVQAVNFDRNGSAGCNLYGVFGTDTLATDSAWQVTRGIFSPDSAAGQPKVNASAYNNGWTISAPDFSLKLTSWIER